MANGCTPELRRRQAELIRRWKPWEQSAVPRTRKGKARVAQNGYKGSARSALRVLARLLRGMAERISR